MKNLVTVIIFFFSFFSYSQEIEVKFDTIEVEIKGNPHVWIKYDNQILAFFKTGNPYTSAQYKQFYVIDSNSENIKQVKVPDELQKAYLDLYVRNDSVFTTEYWDQETYFLNFETYEWEKTRKGDDLTYKDEDYYVTSLDFGEWGGCTWFIDKKTGEQFEMAVTTPIIHKVDSGYMITSGRAIYLLEDPRSLDKSDSPYEYDKVVGSQIGENSFHEPSSSMNGLNVLFQDTSDYWDSDFYIATSFIQNDQLYYLCVDSNALYISQLKNGQLESIYEFNDPVRPLRWSYHDRNRILHNRYQSLQYDTKDDHVYGIFEFNEREIKATYVTNKYRIPVLGSYQSDSWFRENFKYYFKNLDSLYLSTTDSKEVNAFGIDVTPRHKMSTSLKPELELASPKCFQKVEDSLIVMETMYYYTVAEKKVEIIRFEWKENRLFENDFKFIPDEENEAYKAISNKYEATKSFLIENLGEPTSESQARNATKVFWKTEDYMVILYSLTVMDQQEIKVNFEIEMFKN
jgi:hypothetical protein